MNIKEIKHSIIIKSCARDCWTGLKHEWHAELHMWLDTHDDKPPTDIFAHTRKFKTEKECIYFLTHGFRYRVEEIVKEMVKKNPELRVSGKQGGVDIGDRFNVRERKDPVPETKEEWLARNMDDPEPPPEEVEEQRMAEAEAKEER